MKRMNGREPHYDMAAGIMLAWMILGHIASHASFDCGLIKILNQYLSFFMPWFFYKAGRFHRSASMSDTVRHSCNKLLVPFVIYSIIGQMVYYVCLLFEHDISFRSLVYRPVRSLFVAECLPGNGALWFLVALFFVKILGQYCIHRVHSLIPIVIGICVAATCYLLDISWLPCLIPNVAAGLVFYVLGYWLKDAENTIPALIGSAVLYLAISIYGYPSIYFHHNSAPSITTYLLYFPASISGIILLNNFCRMLSPLIKRSLFRWIGENSMNLYVVHWIILMLLRLFILDIVRVSNSTAAFIIYAVVMIMLLPATNALIIRLKVKLQHWNIYLL